uniref:Uncharacterized protein n=1 Tax=Cucumis melo TaxID=3656 RepID=A0A9I9EHK3_CUCME
GRGRGKSKGKLANDQNKSWQAIGIRKLRNLNNNVPKKEVDNMRWDEQSSKASTQVERIFSHKHDIDELHFFLPKILQLEH